MAHLTVSKKQITSVYTMFCNPLKHAPLLENLVSKISHYIRLHYVVRSVYENLPIIAIQPSYMSNEAIQIYSEGITGYEELLRLKNQLSAQQVNNATKLAINDTLRWSRTRIRQSIQETYNIKTKRVHDDDPKKGLIPHFASLSKLWGVITAGHRPINMASLLRTRQTDTGVSVEIMKNQRTVIQSAFLLPNGAVAARGEYPDKGTFVFRHGEGERIENSKGNDAFNTIHSISIATAALNTRAFEKWSKPTQFKYDINLYRQLSRLIQS